jgi:hypothetical protein
MAVVLDAFASYITNMLTEMAREEVGMLLGVPGEIDKMGSRLGDLKNFLADADRRNITDQSVRGWVKELKGIRYQATNILDLCQLKAMERAPFTADVGCFNPLLFCMRNPLFAHDIGTRIRELNQKLDDICKRGNKFNFINLGFYEHNKYRLTSRQAANRETTGENLRSGLVGEKIKEDTRELVEMLTEKKGSTNGGSSNVMLVAIVGVGGI